MSTTTADERTTVSVAASRATGSATPMPQAGLHPERRAKATKPAAPANSWREDPESFLADLFTTYVDTDTTLARYAVRHPLTTVRAIRALRALPILDARLPHSDEAGALRDQLLEHAHSRRIMLGVSAVLDIPTEADSYTEGRERATLRRKVRAAEKQGITVRPVRDDERAGLLALANRHELTNERLDYRIDCPDNDDLLDFGLWLVALDGDGAPIMLSVTPIAGEWGVLRYSRTLVQGQASSDARYLMAREVAEALRIRGVRHLVDSSRPHWLPNGLRHFQRMVGFRLVRVRSVEISER